VNKRLGKGIEALFSANSEMNLTDMVNDIEKTDNYQIREIPLEKLRANPYQPRKEFDQMALEELAQSVREHGVIQPIVVRVSSFGYDILAGERRFRAAKLAQLEHIPAVIKNFSDDAMMQLAILENIQREDLNILEEANGYQSLLDKFDWTQQQLAERMGKSRSHITNILRLLELPQNIQQLLSNDKITMGHAKVLLGLPKDKIDMIIDEVLANGLSVRETERLVKLEKVEPKNVKGPTLTQTLSTDDDIERKFVEDQLIAYLGTKVVLENKKMTISFYDTSELNDILQRIGFTKKDEQ